MSQEIRTEYRAADGKDIFCAVNYATSQEALSDKAVLLVHGLTGYPFIHAFQVAARFFSAKGYDVYRIALYWSGDNHRHLSECTTSTHTRDTQTVIDHLRHKYKRFFVIGHSLAGTSLIGLQHSATSYSFWDCDYIPWEDTWKNARYEPKIDAYYIGWGAPALICKGMIEEAKATSEEQIREKISAISIPTQVIVAEFGQSVAGEKIFSCLEGDKEFQTLKNAGHTFVENDSAERLVAMTHDWFERV